MTQWNFVIAAYAVVGVATLVLIVWAATSMRRAEAAADALKLRT